MADGRKPEGTKDWVQRVFGNHQVQENEVRHNVEDRSQDPGKSYNQGFQLQNAEGDDASPGSAKAANREGGKKGTSVTKQIHPSQQKLQHQLQMFWINQYEEIKQTKDLRYRSFAFARIRKIMKMDKDVQRISAEVPVIFSKACEMFIQELTLRAWNHTEEEKRTWLAKNDIILAITGTDSFDFLDKVELKDDMVQSIPRATPVALSKGVYFLSPQVDPEPIMGDPVIDHSLIRFDQQKKSRIHPSQQKLQHQLQMFWINQYEEIKQAKDLRYRSFPFARIRKIMKMDKGVQRISAEVPVIFSKACEMFIQELTLRAWNHTEEEKRTWLAKNDIILAITGTDKQHDEKTSQA